MPGTILIAYTYRGPVPKIAKRRINDIHRKAYEKLGLFWHQHQLPKHFRKAASAEYRYTPRQGERGSAAQRRFDATYTGQKLKQQGHTRPLELTGESKRQALRMSRVRAFKNYVKVTFAGGNLTWKHPSHKIDMRAEVKRISPQDRERLADKLEQEIAAGYRAITDTETHTA